MGIIQKQATKSTMYIYIGVVIGFLNAGIFFPKYLSPDQKGIIDLLTSISLIFAAIFSLGLPLSTVRLFPRFRKEEIEEGGGYFKFILQLSAVGFILGVVFLFLKEYKNLNEIITSHHFLSLLIILFFFRLIYLNLDSYNRVSYNSVLGVISSNIILKGISLISIILFGLEIIDLNGLLISHVIALSSPGVLSFIYSLNHVKFKSYSFQKKLKSDRKFSKEFYTTSLFGLIGSVGGIFILEIDKYMIYEMMDVSKVGVYTTAAFFGILINIPSRGLRRIASVIIADSWQKNDVENIKDVYQKSTLNLQIISGYLLIGVLICSKYVFTFMKPEYSEGLSILWFIAFAQFFDAITSVNTDILSTSKYYKYQTYFLIGMIVLVVGLNSLLIPKYGIDGAAISTMISLITINLLRTIFIRLKMKLQPFTKKNIGLFVLTALVYVAAFLLDKNISYNPFISLLLVGGVITVLYWSFVLKMKLSPDLNSMAFKLYKRITS